MHIIALISASIQQATEQDLLRAMKLSPEDSAFFQQSLPHDTYTALFQKAFEALVRAGCRQSLRMTIVGTAENDFGVLARVLAIFSFTPPRLLFPHVRWHTTEAGQNRARADLSEILLQDISRARHCLYLATQVLQHFRATRVSTYYDILGLCGCVLYMALYVDMIGQKDSPNGEGSVGTEIIRLDHFTNVDHQEGWLDLRHHFRLHVTGIGVLDSGRSVARLYKEASRIMKNSAGISKMAHIMSAIFVRQAEGHPPELQESQQASPRPEYAQGSA